MACILDVDDISERTGSAELEWRNRWQGHDPSHLTLTGRFSQSAIPRAHGETLFLFYKKKKKEISPRARERA